MRQIEADALPVIRALHRAYFVSACLGRVLCSAAESLPAGILGSGLYGEDRAYDVHISARPTRLRESHWDILQAAIIVGFRQSVT